MKEGRTLLPGEPEKREQTSLLENPKESPPNTQKSLPPEASYADEELMVQASNVRRSTAR